MRQNYVFLFLIFSLCHSCGSVIEVATSLPLGQEPQLIDENVQVGVQYIESGYSYSREGLALSAGSMWKKRRISYLSILITHPRGNLLIDAGLGKNVKEQTKDWPWYADFLLSYESKTDAATVLKKHKVSIDHIFLTHMHWDHAGGIEDFKDVQVWSDIKEQNFAFSNQAELPEFTKAQYDSSLIRWKKFEYQNEPYESFSKSYDFYADGRIVIVPLYGHTPGSIGVFVNVSADERYFFIGDLAWLSEGVKLPSHKSWLGSAIADRNKKMVEQKLIQVHNLQKTRSSLKVLPAHDLNAYNGIKELK